MGWKLLKLYKLDKEKIGEVILFLLYDLKVTNHNSEERIFEIYR